jgi:hypothetical protein
MTINNWNLGFECFFVILSQPVSLTHLGIFVRTFLRFVRPVNDMGLPADIFA